LQVEDDVRDVLADAGQRRELVRDPLDLHRRDGGALQGGEQHPAQRVAERVAEAAVERLDHEHAAVLVHFLVRDLRHLEISRAYCQRVSFLLRALLLRVELDDQLFGNRGVDLGTLRPLEHGAGEPVVVRLQPRGDRGGEVGRVADDLLRARARLQRDDVVGLDLVARDVDPAPVHREVPVADELPRLRARGGEAEAVDDVVKPRLEHPEQVLARDAALLVRLLVVRAELRLEQAVVPARLLLLPQLQQVLALLDPAAAVLARRVRAALDRALLGEAALALQEELHALPAALLALGGTIASHLHTPPLLLPDAVVRLRRDVLHSQNLQTRRLQRADRGLAARTRAFDEHLDLLQAVLHALARGGVGGDLRRERRRLARALEPGGAGRLPHDHVPVLVRQGDDRVVERRLDVRLTDRDVLADAAARATAGRGSPGRRHYFAFFPRPTVFFGPFRVRAFVFVRCPRAGRLR